MKKLLSAVVMATAFGATSASAAGFALDTMSARATGQGSAMTAGVDDSSAVYYNPAGLVQTKGLSLMAGAHIIIPGVSFTPADGSGKVSVAPNPATPPHLFAALKLSDDVAFGLGVYTPFGNTAQWPEGWVGEQLITRSSLQTFYFSPSFAFRIADRFRAGLGMDFVRATVAQSRTLNFVDTQGSLSFGGATWGTGANAGIQVDIIKEMLTAGVAYRSSVLLPFEGAVDFRDVPPELQGTLVDQNLTADFTLPSQWQLGLSYKPMEKLRLGFDAWYVDWSSFKSLRVEFEDPALTSDDPKRWQGVWSFRVGGEYAVNDRLSVRAGFKYDPTPSPQDTLAPNLPDANRVTINVGGGYAFGALIVDLAYQLTLLNSYESTYAPLPGTYGGTAHVIGVTVGYGFDVL